jgi:two-component system sensor histidine kinase DesK
MVPAEGPAGRPAVTAAPVAAMAPADGEVRRARAVVVARVVAYLFVVGMLGFGLLPIAHGVVDHHPLWRIAAGVAGFTAVALCFIRLVGVAVRRPWRNLARWETGIVTVLVLVLPVTVDRGWQVLGFLAMAAALVALPPRMGLLVAASLLGCVTAERVALRVDGVPYLAVQDVLTALALAGIVVLVAFVAELFAARAEVARLAVAAERARFAQDLHDTLGHNLSAIALKSELALRLVETDPVRAVAELTDVPAVARDSLRDVRTVVKGYRRDSLEREIQGVQSVLVAAGVRCTVSPVPADLSTQVEEALAGAVREGATNLLRHSAATRCDIVMDAGTHTIRLDMTNDAARVEPSGRDAVQAGGTGLDGIAERIARLGGTLAAGVDPSGEFRLTVTVPRAAAGRQ